MPDEVVALREVPAAKAWGGIEASMRLEGALHRIDPGLLEVLASTQSALDDYQEGAPTLIAWVRNTTARELARRSGGKSQVLGPLCIPASEAVGSLNAAALLYVRFRDFAFAGEGTAIAPAVFFARLWRAMASQLELVPSANEVN